jgi:hypothetical protein
VPSLSSAYNLPFPLTGSAERPTMDWKAAQKQLAKLVNWQRAPNGWREPFADRGHLISAQFCARGIGSVGLESEQLSSDLLNPAEESAAQTTLPLSEATHMPSVSFQHQLAQLNQQSGFVFEILPNLFDCPATFLFLPSFLLANLMQKLAHCFSPLCSHCSNLSERKLVPTQYVNCV